MKKLRFYWFMTLAVAAASTQAAEFGINATGSHIGGFFQSDNSSAGIAQSANGIRARGTSSGGVFYCDGGSGFAEIASINKGIEAQGGEYGGYFKDTDLTSEAWVAYGDTGVRGFGNASGGYFEDKNGTGYAHVGVGNQGIRGFGTWAGGFFVDTDNEDVFASVAAGNLGIEAFGTTTGGYFKNRTGTGYARAGHYDVGINAQGSRAGGYFIDSDDGGYAYVGYGSDGIRAYGEGLGGYFEDTGEGGVWASVANGFYKIIGLGAVSFMQNHPDKQDRVIVYAAPEGDEVATYTRGSAVLIEGEARIPLGETFKWVTNPDIGLTAHLTPQGEGTVLYVASKTTEELIVRSMEGFPDDVTFDYIVYGLRIGFEEISIVQQKTQEAYIPSMEEHQMLYTDYPELQQYNALERFGRMRVNQGMAARPDMSGAEALMNKIKESVAEVHELPIGEAKTPQ